MHTSGHTMEHRRTLNVFVLAMLSLAVVVSLRNLPMAANYGLSSFFFWIAAGILFMIPTALVSAELASGWPKSGGVYIWVKEALGERWGFFAIWMQWFHNMTWYPAMLAFVGAGIAYIFNPAWAESKGYLMTVILIGIWAITFINFFGIKLSAWVTTIGVIIGTILPGLVLVILAIYWIISGRPLQTEVSWNALIPDMTDRTNLVFLAGIFLALSGIEANANLAREVKNPQRSFPRALFIAAILILGILSLGTLAIAIVIPKAQIGLVSGVLEAFRAFFSAYRLDWLVPVIAFFTILGALGELNAWTIAGVKGLFVTTEHGALPPFLHKVNDKHIPTRLLIFQAIIVTITTFVFLYLPNIDVSYWMLSALSAQMYLIMYIFLLIAGIVLRYKRPNVKRIYQIPFQNMGMWIVVIVGIASTLFGLAVSFLPPAGVSKPEVAGYEILLISGIVVICLIPLVIFAFRKPHWKIEVLSEIREEIHRSFH